MPRFDDPFFITCDVREGDFAEIDLSIEGDADPFRQDLRLEELFDFGVSGNNRILCFQNRMIEGQPHDCDQRDD